MSEQRESLLEFPCDFPIKIMGKASEDFTEVVLEIVRPHVPDLAHARLAHNASKGGRYTAITLTIRATSQAQLDAIYYALTAHERVLVAL